MIDAARTILDGSLDGMRQAIVGASAEGFNWRPAGDDTNSIAALAVHSMHSTRMWLAVATGSPRPERDRPSEFLAEAEDPAELMAFYDDMAGQCLSLLDAEVVFDPGAQHESPGLGAGDADTVTSAWALLHAIEHLREHVGHVQLTRQLWDQRL